MANACNKGGPIDTQPKNRLYSHITMELILMQNNGILGIIMQNNGILKTL